jgi:hypothetical protein
MLLLDVRRCARGADGRKFDREEPSVSGKFMGSDDLEGGTQRTTKID